MRLLRVIRFNKNWNRVPQLHYELQEKGKIISLVSNLIVHDYDIEKLFAEFEINTLEKKQKIYKVVSKFGPRVPNKTQYPIFKKFRDTSKMIPSEKAVLLNSEYQKAWDVAYQWAKDYEYKNSNQAIIDGNKAILEAIQANGINNNKSDPANEIALENHKQKKLLELEQRIKKLEKKITTYEAKQYEHE